MRKPDGCYVFLEPRGPCEVEIQSVRYSTMSILVDPSALSADDPVISIRLLRRPDLRFPGCDRLEGFAPPGVTVYAFHPEDPPLNLRGGKGGVLALGGYTAKPLRGLRFSVGAGISRELFVMEEKLPDGSWRISPALARPHEPGEEVERASACLSAPDGRFAVCVERGAASHHLQYFSEEAKKWVCLPAPVPR